MADYPPRNCKICGKSFKPKMIHHIMCPNIICKWTRLQQQKKQWKLDNEPKLEEEYDKCIWCGDTYKVKRRDQATCGGRKCINKHQNWRKSIRGAQKDEQRSLGEV